jgi:hypothetical protein
MPKSLYQNWQFAIEVNGFDVALFHKVLFCILNCVNFVNYFGLNFILTNFKNYFEKKKRVSARFHFFYSSD